MMRVRDFKDYITNGVEIILWSVDDKKYISKVVNLSDLEDEESPLLDLEVYSIKGYTDYDLQINVFTKEKLC